MVFASLIFIFIFLPLNLLLYYAIDNRTYRNWLLVVFSVVFYSWGEPIWIGLMVFSAFIDYLNALFIERFRNTKWARIGLVSTAVVNLGLLMTFKYSGFIVENVNALLGTHFAVPFFALPIGISFYTFQSLSYVVDVYRGEVKAQRSFMKFFMFVSLYHQLVAGPIVRYQHIAHEIDNRKENIRAFSEGINRFCIGLFKKVFFANIAGSLASQYLDGDLTTLSTSAAWFGIIMFSLQIYFDFSAYSDMAIGMGWMFGFHYHENFKYPYLANSVTDFWRRWHISLSTFFRDYVYIPLGGNRKRMVFNLMFVWFLTGLWHGASWNFILWGMYFGVFILLERLFLQKFFSYLPRVFSHLYLLLVVVIGWALFYFTDFGRLLAFSKVLFGANGHRTWDMDLWLNIGTHAFWIFAALICCLPVFHWVKRLAHERLGGWQLTAVNYGYIAINVSLILVSTAYLVGKSYNPFLYFRF
jgi:alginate O-acetyltransferase complex protein AlgI